MMYDFFRMHNAIQSTTSAEAFLTDKVKDLPQMIPHSYLQKYFKIAVMYSPFVISFIFSSTMTYQV